MLRRAVVISSILGAVSAAAALAVAPDLAHVGRIVSGLAPWTSQGFTVAPPSGPMHRLAPDALGQPSDSLAGTFCRFPEPGSGHSSAAGSNELLTPLDSADVSLLGQSRLIKPDSSAICSGSNPPALP